MTELSIESLRLRVAVGADHPIENLSDGEGPVLPVLVENGEDIAEQNLRLFLRPITLNVAARPGCSTASRNFVGGRAHVALPAATTACRAASRVGKLPSGRSAASYARNSR